MKANAYGHGLEALAPIAVGSGAEYIGICTNSEAAIVRRLGRDIKIMRLRTGLPKELKESVDGLNIEEQVGSLETAEYLSAAGVKRGRRIPVHLDVDTGMGRSGFASSQIEELKKVCSLAGLAVAGMMTHFASADDRDLTFTGKQIEEFDNLHAALRDYLPDSVLIHTHNSAATVRLTSSRKDLVRVGAACYGVRTSRNFENPSELTPVMSIRTNVAEVRAVPAGRTIGYGRLFTTRRDSLIAALPVGFGEGYPRALFNKGIVLIHGCRCPVVGRVSLNLTSVDVTDVPQPVRWGDEAVLVGRQKDAEITFEELADKFQGVHTEINLMAGSMNAITYAD